eukprot:762714-Hanusia_phi.AAC.4
MRSLLTEQVLGTCQSVSQCPSGAPSAVLPCCYLFQTLLKDSCKSLNYTLYYKYTNPVRSIPSRSPWPHLLVLFSPPRPQVEGICNFATNCYIGGTHRLGAHCEMSLVLALLLLLGMRSADPANSPAAPWILQTRQKEQTAPESLPPAAAPAMHPSVPSYCQPSPPLNTTSSPCPTPTASSLLSSASPFLTLPGPLAPAPTPPFWPRYLRLLVSSPARSLGAT